MGLLGDSGGHGWLAGWLVWGFVGQKYIERINGTGSTVSRFCYNRARIQKKSSFFLLCGEEKTRQRCLISS